MRLSTVIVVILFSMIGLYLFRLYAPLGPRAKRVLTVAAVIFLVVWVATEMSGGRFNLGGW
jgi:hypothetical protein